MILLYILSLAHFKEIYKMEKLTPNAFGEFV